MIGCKCGCGQLFNDTDKYGRKRKYINGHQGRNDKSCEFLRRLNKEKYNNGKGWLDSEGYISVMYNGKEIRQHRLVMQQHLDRELESYEHVHHINGNRLDNRIENLELMTSIKHNSITVTKRWQSGEMLQCHVNPPRDPNTGRFMKK